MKKKWISFLMTFVMCIGMLPATALANDVKPLMECLVVGGTWVIQSGETKTTSGTGWSYADGVLTLENGAELEGEGAGDNSIYNNEGIFVFGMDLKIVVKGNVSVTGKAGITAQTNTNTGESTNLEITGNGTMHVTGTGGDGIYATDNLKIDDTTVHVTSTSSGLDVRKAATITNGATVSVDSSSFGISAIKGVTVNGGSKVYVESDHMAYGSSSSNSMEISGEDTVVYLGYKLGEDHLPVLPLEEVNASFGVCDSTSPVKLNGGTFYAAEAGSAFKQTAGFASLNGNITVMDEYVMQNDLTIGSGKTLTLEDGAVLTLNKGTTVHMDGTAVANGNGYVLDHGADIYVNGEKHTHDYTDTYYTNKTETTHIEMLRCKDCPVKAAKDVTQETHVGNPCECGMTSVAMVTPAAGDPVYYYTMDGAINALQDGSALKLLTNVKTSEDKVIANTGITIDLNGYEWDLGKDNLEIGSSASVTMMSSDEGTAGSCKTTAGTLIENKGTLSLNSGTYTGDWKSVVNNGTLEVNGATLQAKSDAGNVIYNDENGALKLKSGMAVGGEQGVFSVSAIELWDAFKITGYKESAFCVFSYAAPIAVKDTLTGTRTVYVEFSTNTNEGITIAEADAGITPQKEWFEAANDGYVVTFADQKWIVEKCNHADIDSEKGECNICRVAFVAKRVTDTEVEFYEKVEDAINASGNVTLLQSAKSKEFLNASENTLILDTNGKTLTLDQRFSIGIKDSTIIMGGGILDAVFNNYGTLELKDVTVKDKITNGTEKYPLGTYHGILKVSGNVVLAKVLNEDGCFIKVTDSLGSGASIKCDAGEGTVVAKPDGDYKITASDAEKFSSVDGKWMGQLDADGNVVLADKKKLADTMITLSEDHCVYSAEIQQPTVIVKDGETTLNEGTDYTITWPADSRNVGVKTATIIGQGKYVGEKTVTYEITPAAISVTDAVVAEKIYDGTTDVEISSVVLSGICGSDYVTVSYDASLDDANAGNRVLTLENIKLNEESAGNYTLRSDIFQKNVKVKQAPARKWNPLPQTIINGMAKEYTIDLSNFAPNAPLSWGENTEYSVVMQYDEAVDAAYQAINAETKGDQLAIKVPEIDQSKTGTVALAFVTIKSQNYEESKMNFMLIASNKTAVTLEGRIAAKAYDGSAVDVPEMTAKVGENAVAVAGYAYTWQTAEGTPLAEAPKNAGNYKVVVSVLDTDEVYTGSTEIEFSITKAVPTGTPQYITITSGGKTLADAALTTEGGTFNVDGSVMWEAETTTAVEQNTEYTWIFTPADAANYEILKGTITLWSYRPSGGGGSSTSVKADDDQVTIDTSSSSVSEKDADKAIDKAVKNDSDEIIIDTNKGKVTLPEGMAEKITDETDADLVVETKNGTVTIPNGTLEELDAEGKVTVEVTKNKVVISDEDGELSDIGKVEVTVPYKENSETGNVAVEVTKADGTKEVIEDVYDGKNSVTFEVDGSVTFEIIDNYVPLADVPVVPEQPAENSFKDVSEKDWFYKAVMYVSENGLMNGVDANNFGPSVNTTRGMITTILWRLEGNPAAGTVPFIDVDADMYYAEAIAWAAEKGIVSGYGLDFGPDDNITREQLATILYRYAQYKEDGFEGLWAFRLDFTDVAEMSEYAYEPMCWGVMNGIISGNDDGTLNPAGHAQRAHAAQMLMKFLENVK